MIATLTRYLLPTAGAVGLLLVGILYVQTQRLESAQRQLVEVRVRLEAAKKAIVQLELDAARVAERQEIRDRAREDIVSAPASDDGPVAPVLERALRASDEIGGIK